MCWIYEGISREEFETAIRLVEQMIQSYGGIYLGEYSERDTQFMAGRETITEELKQKVFRYGEEYVRVGRLYFSQKPFIVLEFGGELYGPYEDAEPFPFDLERDALEQEIRYSLGVEPYPKA